MSSSKIKDYLFLHSILIIYSLSSIFSKLASAEKFLSEKFIMYYGMVLGCLMVYALLWQQVLKKMPLTTAFANKAVVIVWGILWGSIFFQETITLSMLLGGGIIFFGIYLVVSDDD